MTRHCFDPSILRAYDIRGIVGETLTARDTYMVGRTFATFLAQKGGQSVCVGYDGRLSSPALEEALIKGLLEGGRDVIRIGMGPTPMVYFAQKHLQTDAGIMISGSHNPPNYNGIKLTLASSPFYGKDIQYLDVLAKQGNLIQGKGTLSHQSLLNAYVDRLFLDYKTYYSSGRPLKVAWDTGNGAAGPVVQALTAKLPGEHLLLNIEVDGTFPVHHPDPAIPKNLEQLQETVCSHHCDFGIAFDGDGDRLSVVDCLGRILFGDQLLIFYAEEVLRSHPGAKIIADVKCSQTTFEAIPQLGGEVLMWRTGHSLIKAKMVEIGAILAAEMSGHIFFADRYYGFDDALYSAVRLFGSLSVREESLEAWYNQLPVTFSTSELYFDCEGQQKFTLIEKLRQHLDNQKISYIAIDGIRMKTSEGWWLLRASNTQDMLTARLEAASEKGLRSLQASLKGYLQAIGCKVS